MQDNNKRAASAWERDTAVLDDVLAKANGINISARMSSDLSEVPSLEAVKDRSVRRQAKQSQAKRTVLHIMGSVLLIAFIISISSLLGYTIVRGALDLTGMAQDEFEVDVEIPENATIKQVAEILNENGIISYPEFFIFYANRQDSEIFNHGVFTLSSAMTYSSIIERLQSVSTVRQTVSIRIQEGMTAQQIGKLLEENRVCRADAFEKFYTEKLNKFSFEKRLLQSKNKYYQLEGYLFPDTYEFYVTPEVSEDSEHDSEKIAADLELQAKIAAETMYDNFNQKFTKEMYKTINEMGFNLDQFIIIASMVQWEAATQEDMELVASVFLNRIRSSHEFPLLESDVTSKYAKETFGYNQTMVTLYDTYVTPGLPPGPICNPGMDAMMAVINAPQTEFFYFCADLETQEVFYAKTLEGHNENLKLAGLVIGQ